MANNKWIEALPVGASFKEVWSEDYDYEPGHNIYTKLSETAILSTDPRLEDDDMQLIFGPHMFGETEKFEVVE